MSGIWLDVDAAVTVFVNLVPLIDSTDFVTVEDAVVYNASGMDLRWNFTTTAGVITSTAITPTTSGDYDWTHVGDGIYKLELPASGGASVNNNTKGFGFLSGRITGVLPFRGPINGFRAAALNDALIDGGDNLDVNVTQFEGTNATASGGRPEVNTSHVAGSAVDQSGGLINANVKQISGDATAADNLESYLDGSEFMPVDAHKPEFAIAGVTLTVKKPDDTTTAYTKTLATDAAADPIISST